MLLATAAAGALPGEAIVIAFLGMLGVAATAFGPVLLERFKREPAVTAPTIDPPITAPVPDAGPDPFELLEEQIRDLRAQRDAATARAERLDGEIRELRVALTARIDELSRQLREAELHLVRVEASRRGWGP